MDTSLPFVPDVLPCLPLDERSSLPKAPGIYLVVKNDGEVLYVGATSNLNRRWIRHHRLQDFQKFPHVAIAYYLCKRSELNELEPAMINHFQPTLPCRKWIPSHTGLPSRRSHGLFAWVGPKTIDLVRRTSDKICLSQGGVVAEAIRQFAKKEKIE
jgi:hypothetical protein